MSKVAIQGNASGTGTLTIAAPNTNTDRTLTLPDSAGTIDTLQRAGNVLQVVNAYTNGNTFSFSANYDNPFGPSASITPSSSANKILIIATGSVYISASGESHVDISANGVRISAGGFGDGLCLIYHPSTAMALPYVITHLHSPTTTSTVTYSVIGHHIGGTKITSNSFRASDLSQIFLLEIAS